MFSLRVACELELSLCLEGFESCAGDSGAKLVCLLWFAYCGAGDGRAKLFVSCGLRIVVRLKVEQIVVLFHLY